MANLTFDEVLKRARDFTAVISRLTDRKLDEITLAIGKEKHRRLINDEDHSRKGMARVYVDPE